MKLPVPHCRLLLEPAETERVGMTGDWSCRWNWTSWVSEWKPYWVSAVLPSVWPDCSSASAAAPEMVLGADGTSYGVRSLLALEKGYQRRIWSAKLFSYQMPASIAWLPSAQSRLEVRPLRSMVYSV